MLIISDRVRKALQNHSVVDDEIIRILHGLLRNLTANFESVEFDHILIARLNNLLDAVIDTREDSAWGDALADTKALATTIRNRWNRKFQPEFFIINDLREEWLFGPSGLLANVQFNEVDPGASSPKWEAVERASNADSKTIQFEPGR
jgi:hypothetical protein